MLAVVVALSSANPHKTINKCKKIKHNELKKKKGKFSTFVVCGDSR